MITIKLNDIATCDQDVVDFFKSIKAHASSDDAYEILQDDQSPSSQSRIIITLPNNCIVLGRDWDKYIEYALTNELPKWKDSKTGAWVYARWDDYVIRRMGLISRPDNGIFQGMSVEILQSNDVNNAVATS